ncbi:MAG TPA: ABC transporter substrate-binding protein, partial [Burkholderiaceae bacterium]|nr:ABC transporter substrate-binding protein [Burkholderiaceae bacterium]
MHSLVRKMCRLLGCALISLFAALPAHARQGTVTVTDLAGRTVAVPANVERILLGEGRLLPALAVFHKGDPARRLVAMMGEFEKLDAPGYAQWARAFPQIDRVPRVGRTTSGSFSDEQAIALRPQLAILGLAGGHGPSERDRETLARLEAAGVAVVFIDLRHDPLGNTPRSMLVLGEVLDKQAEAEAFVTFWRKQLTLVTERLAEVRPESPTVFLENRVGLSEGCCDTMVGLVGKLLDAAGSRNVAKDLIPGEFGTLNPEFLIARQPDFYIGTGIGALTTAQQTPLRIVLGADATPEAARASLARAVQRRGIAQLQAVKEGRAYAMWHHFYNSPFNVVAVQVFAKWL